MRMRLWRRRLSISSPRMIVRSALPWPFRWAFVAMGLGFSAALALWAFETGKDIAGVDPGAKKELARLRDQVASLKEERDSAVSIASSADSLLKAERATQATLAQQLKQAEAEKLALKADLGFFERLLPPPSGAQAVSVRGLQADVESAGVLRVQVLIMKGLNDRGEFLGRAQITLSGSLDGRTWSMAPQPAGEAIRVRQMLRLDQRLQIPERAVVKSVQLRVLDSQGVLQASQSISVPAP
jgi:hypothetical protein